VWCRTALCSVQAVYPGVDADVLRTPAPLITSCVTGRGILSRIRARAPGLPGTPRSLGVGARASIASRFTVIRMLLARLPSGVLAEHLEDHPAGHAVPRLGQPHVPRVDRPPHDVPVPGTVRLTACRSRQPSTWPRVHTATPPTTPTPVSIVPESAP
jgi:hypothetical protein